jgi:hypothetical protein
MMAVTGNPGTGAVTAGAAITGFQALAAGDNGNTFDIEIFSVDANGNRNGMWETQSGSTWTFSGTSFSRSAGNVVDGSSGPGTLVNFASGTQQVSVEFSSVRMTNMAYLTVAETFTAAQTITPTQAANTSVDGLILADATPATSGNQQFSPRLRLTGQGWKTTSVAASQEVDFIIENQPVQGTAAPTGNLVFSSQVAGGGYQTCLQVASGGAGLYVGNVANSVSGIVYFVNGGSGYVNTITATGTGWVFSGPSNATNTLNAGGFEGPTYFLNPNAGLSGLSTSGSDVLLAGQSNINNNVLIKPGWSTTGGATKFLNTAGTTVLTVANNGWIQGDPGAARITTPVTNATATMSSLTDLTLTLVAGRKYFGELVLFAHNSTAAEGLQFDLNGGSATMTSIEFGFAGAAVGATGGVVVSTALGTALTDTVVSTTDVCYVIPMSLVVNAAGTIIPRFAEVSHTTGTATINNGFFRLFDSPN